MDTEILMLRSSDSSHVSGWLESITVKLKVREIPRMGDGNAG
jgi:hypothetical protein